MIPWLRSVVRAVWRRVEWEAKVAEEFRFHLERRAEDLIRSGLSPAEARRRARLEFGSTERYREEGMEARGLRHFDELRRDVRYLLRTLVSRDRAFSLTVLLTLGVCIGANVAIYSVVETVVLNPLPYEQPDRLVTMYNMYPGLGGVGGANGSPDFFFRRERVARLEEVAAYRGAGSTVGEPGNTERVSSLHVTPSFFPMLGLEPTLGRTFLEEEMNPPKRTVVLTHGYWQEQFGGSPDVLGQSLQIDGRSMTIVGVLGEGSWTDARIVLPLSFSREQRTLETWHSNSYSMLGRLAPGATVQQVQAEIDALNALVSRKSLAAKGVAAKEPVPLAATETRTRRSRVPRTTLVVLMATRVAYGPFTAPLHDIPCGWEQRVMCGAQTSVALGARRATIASLRKPTVIVPASGFTRRIAARRSSELRWRATD